MNVSLLLVLFSGVSFLIYGIGSFNSRRMTSEYKRWGYEDYRYLIGGFQFIGGLGLLIGLAIDHFLLISSTGLTIMMIIAVSVRIKIKDSFKMMLPAIIYTIINGIIFYLNI